VLDLRDPLGVCGRVRRTLDLWCLVLALWLSACSQPGNDVTDSDQFRSGFVTVAVVPEADAWIHAAAQYRNNNYGSNTQGVLTSSPSERMVVRFSPLEIHDALAGEYVSAKLEFSVFSAFDFGTGETVHLHRLLQGWEEDEVTFNCAIDSDTTNSDQDCSGPTQWDLESGGDNPWIENIATATITDSSTVLEFDLTAEVAGILDGTIGHQGWILMLEDGTPGFGRIELRESSNPPRLLIESDPEPPGTTTDWSPPEPEEVAPELDLTVSQDTAERVAFLYEGPEPVQIGRFRNLCGSQEPDRGRGHRCETGSRCGIGHGCGSRTLAS
jgi:hypothetical protein